MRSRGVRAAALTLALLAAGCGGGGDSGPEVAIASLQQVSGEVVRITLEVGGDAGGTVDVAVHWSRDGAAWAEAVRVSGTPTPEGIPAGTTFTFNWDAFDDLGCAFEDTLHVRAMVSGAEKDRNGPISLTTYREADAADLRNDLQADLAPDGTLDGLALFDTRDAADYAQGAIPGAVNSDDPTGRPKDFRLVFYCYGGS